MCGGALSVAHLLLPVRRWRKVPISGSSPYAASVSSYQFSRAAQGGLQYKYPVISGAMVPPSVAAQAGAKAG
jgi:hypothetical protein